MIISYFCGVLFVCLFFTNVYRLNDITSRLIQFTYINISISTINVKVQFTKSFVAETQVALEFLIHKHNQNLI